jgi:hypothetical protein
VESQYVTLKKSDDNFFSYLEGSFSKELRAIPEQSLNVNTSREQVTFKLKRVKEIKKPPFVFLLYKLFRGEWLSLSLGPILVTYAYLYQQNISIDHYSAIQALITVIFFHAGIFALNDYRDYVSGIDRLQINRGSQVIYKGWLSAQEVKKIGTYSLQRLC